MDNKPLDKTTTESFGATAAQYSADAAIKIDWFNFETRMRNLVREMIDPVVDNHHDNKSSIEQLEIKQEVSLKYMYFIFREWKIKFKNLNIKPHA